MAEIEIAIQGRKVGWEVADLVALILIQNLVGTLGPGKDVETETKQEEDEGPKPGEWTDIYAKHFMDEERFTHRFLLLVFPYT